MLFLKRRLKTQLDLIQPKNEEVAKQKILKQIDIHKKKDFKNKLQANLAKVCYSVLYLFKNTVVL